MSTITFYDQSLKSELQADVLESRPDPRGFWLRLDQTLFYPEGGGMLRDRGTIQDLEVLDLKKESGEIWHLVPSQLSGRIQLKLDLKDRLERMKRSCQKKAAVSLLCGLLACSAVLLPACSRSSSEQNIVTAAELPGETMQASISFPDWDGKTEPSLAVNALYSFTGFSGQGELYITPSADVTGFTLYVNSQRIPTDQMPGGSTWKVDISSMVFRKGKLAVLTQLCRILASLASSSRSDISFSASEKSF